MSLVVGAPLGVLVLLLHSLVEFPLRMPALACIFAALLAIMMAPPPRHATPGRRRSARKEDPLQDTPEVPVAVAPPLFRVASEGSPRRRSETAERLERGQKS